MTVAVRAAPFDVSPRAATGAPDDLVARLQVLLAARCAPPARLERRARRRYPFPYLLRVTPLDGPGPTAPAAIIACGKDLSLDGISFYHPRPLPHRRVAIALEAAEHDSYANELVVLASLDWCRFTSRGWYLSGGRLLRLLVHDERS